MAFLCLASLMSQSRNCSPGSLVLFQVHLKSWILASSMDRDRDTGGRDFLVPKQYFGFADIGEDQLGSEHEKSYRDTVRRCTKRKLGKAKETTTANRGEDSKPPKEMRRTKSLRLFGRMFLILPWLRPLQKAFYFCHSTAMWFRMLAPTPFLSRGCPE